MSLFLHGRVKPRVLSIAIYLNLCYRYQYLNCVKLKISALLIKKDEKRRRRKSHIPFPFSSLGKTQVVDCDDLF